MKWVGVEVFRKIKVIDMHIDNVNIAICCNVFMSAKDALLCHIFVCRSAYTILYIEQWHIVLIEQFFLCVQPVFALCQELKP